MKTITLAACLTTALIGAIVPVAPAADVTPEVSGPFHVERRIPIADCGTFQVVDNVVADAKVIVFFDRKGNALSVHSVFQGTDNITNSMTGGSFASKFQNVLLVDLQEGLGAEVGLVSAVTIPNYGSVFQESGRIVIDEPGHVFFQAGPHRARHDDAVDLCAALG